jgi:hypothetical protein
MGVVKPPIGNSPCSHDAIQRRLKWALIVFVPSLTVVGSYSVYHALGFPQRLSFTTDDLSCNEVNRGDIHHGGSLGLSTPLVF